MYAPNQYCSDFFKLLNKTLSNLLDFAVIIGADMNAVLDPLLYISGTLSQHTHPATTAFQDPVGDFSLTDLFRATLPQDNIAFTQTDIKPTQE